MQMTNNGFPAEVATFTQFLSKNRRSEKSPKYFANLKIEGKWYNISTWEHFNQRDGSVILNNSVRPCTPEECAKNEQYYQRDQQYRQARQQQQGQPVQQQQQMQQPNMQQMMQMMMQMQQMMGMAPQNMQPQYDADHQQPQNWGQPGQGTAPVAEPTRIRDEVPASDIPPFEVDDDAPF